MEKNSRGFDISIELSEHGKFNVISSKLLAADLKTHQRMLLLQSAK
ncbi:hypothetical protein ALC56_15227 [Trachymyrmex septentrionalis]|uniref:Uncharacterized protein n=1 Tax=Trachymyrmex septentrionalis TaxID=34720 RepID=A0A195EQS8_9HYME|nr:hypothetical protein ALC56_15227 [Trachymyrmex septentrionalis]